MSPTRTRHSAGLYQKPVTPFRGDSVVLGRSLALREAEQQFRAVADSVPVMIWTAGTDRGYTYFSPQWLEFRGRVLEDELGLGWVEGVHPEDAAGFFSAYDQAFEIRAPFRVEYRLLRHDGVYRWILDHGVPQYEPDGTFGGYAGSCIDITERRELELALERRMRQQAVVADLGAYALEQSDPRRLMEEAARRVCEILKVDACRVLRVQPDRSSFLVRAGTIWQGDRYVALDAQSGTDTLALHALRAGEPVRADYPDPDQQFEGPGSLHASPYTSALGTVIGWVAKPYGVLMVHAFRPVCFSHDDEFFLRAVANLLHDALVRKRVERTLTHTNRELKRRVAERTSELVEANELLQQKVLERTRADAALQRSEAQFRALFESSPDAIFVESLEGTVFDVNPAACRLHGMQREELLGRHIRELVPALEVDRTLERFNQLVSGELSYVEGYSLRADGTAVPVEVRASRFTFSDQPAMLLHVNDISERKRTEEQLHREKEFSELLIHSSVDGIVAFDTELRYTVWNPGMERISGVPKEHCLGRRTTDVFSFLKETGEDLNQKAALAGEHVISQNRRYYIHETGREGYFEAHYSPLRTHEGGIIGGVGIIRDITAQKASAEALRRSETRFAKAFQAAPVAMVITRLGSGRIVDANESFARMSEYSRDAVIGQKASDLGLAVHRVLRDRVTDILEEGASYVDVEAQILTKSGIVRDVLSSGEFIEFGGETCLLSMFYDITERKRLEREVLEIAESERRRIGQDLHDGLGQQLTGIAFLSRILERNLEGISSGHAAQMHRIVELIAQAISYTRNLSRMLSPVDISAEGLTEALQRLVESTSEYSDITCRMEGGAEVQVNSNTAATHLYRIAQEAINNALKHATPKEIVVELVAQDRQGVLRIRDDGQGMPDGFANCNSGMGIRTMQYRGNVIGGALKVYPGKEGGTVIECRFPLVEG